MVLTSEKVINICVQVVRLLYTNSGIGLLALGSNAIQRLWKWNRSERNPSGKVYMLILYCFLMFWLIQIGV